MEAAAYWQREYDATYSPEAAVRLAFVCWWVLLEHGCIPMAEPLTEKDFAHLGATLTAVADDALARHEEDPHVLFHFGFMASLVPWYFAPNGPDDAVTAWEERARAMLRRAHRLRPDDAAYEVGFRGNRVETEEERGAYEEARRRAYVGVQKRYGGAGEFDLYFRGMLAV